MRSAIVSACSTTRRTIHVSIVIIVWRWDTIFFWRWGGASHHVGMLLLVSVLHAIVSFIIVRLWRRCASHVGWRHTWTSMLILIILIFIVSAIPSHVLIIIHWWRRWSATCGIVCIVIVVIIVVVIFVVVLLLLILILSIVIVHWGWCHLAIIHGIRRRIRLPLTTIRHIWRVTIKVLWWWHAHGLWIHECSKRWRIHTHGWWNSKWLRRHAIRVESRSWWGCKWLIPKSTSPWWC
mmetsp:Transcript_11081/g.41360  ORF Transcript_11081/g.41360 Transcript_11081/m.41360 type:complete len:236 (+) Transcript_11081:4165-4872(+)